MTTRREKELEELADLLVRTARPYRRIFFRNNWPGPWQCCECGDWIYEPDDLEVHHSDYDGKNNAVENLDPIHPLCHMQHHGKRADMKHVAAGKWAKPGAARRHRMAMRNAPRIECEHCGTPILVGWYPYHLRRVHGL